MRGEKAKGKLGSDNSARRLEVWLYKTVYRPAYTISMGLCGTARVPVRIT